MREVERLEGGLQRVERQDHGARVDRALAALAHVEVDEAAVPPPEPPWAGPRISAAHFAQPDLPLRTLTRAPGRLTPHDSHRGDASHSIRLTDPLSFV
ncbi:MAG: hypothetical protein SangKO_046630 [Sandaracinaceae bacterium]